MPRVLLKNAAVWVWDEGFEGHVEENQTVVVDGDEIASVSSSADLEDDSATTVINLTGGLVLPGLTDAHIHVELLGESSFYVNLAACDSVAALLDVIRAKLHELSSMPFVMGFNWDQNRLGRMPSRGDLDSLPTEQPIFLWRMCWHIAVCNTAALRVANLLHSPPPSVAGGVVDADAQGLPTGILKERAVEPLIAALAKTKTTEQRTHFIELGLEMCRRFGLTCVQTNDENAIPIYCELEASDRLPIRVMLTPLCSELERVLEERPEHTCRLENGRHKNRLVIDRVKIFSDGSLGAETAAVRTFSGHTGILIHELEDLIAQIVGAERVGMRLEVHAIGDAAAEQVLRAIESASAELGRLLNRPIITHCQLLGEDLIARMEALGVIANVQPSFVPTDTPYVLGRLSAVQEKGAYAWRTMMRTGVRVAGGSDAPIETANPFTGLHDAIHRSTAHRVAEGVKAHVYRPEECLSFAEALHLYTKGGAFAGGCEARLGSVRAGFLADLVVCDVRCVEDASRLHALKPALVMVGGQVVHLDLDQGVSVAVERCAEESFYQAAAEFDPPLSRLQGATGLPGKSGRPEARLGFCQCCVLGEFCFSAN